MSKTNLIDSYLNKEDWRVNENANSDTTFSGLMAYISTSEIAKYTLDNIYPPDISNAHKNGDMHIHDLGYGFIPYCCGWSLGKLIKEGINKIPGKASSAPAKHLNSLMIQMVNFLGCMQMEAAGAQAFNNVDTHLAPFVKKDNLSYAAVKQYMQQLVFNLNIPSRWGCLSEDSELLTIDGFKPYYLVKQGEHIATYNMKKQKVEYYPIRKMNVYDFRGELVRFCSDNLDILTTPNHRNVVRWIGKFEEEIFYSNQLFESPLSFSIPYYEKEGHVMVNKYKFSKIGEKSLYKYNGKVWCPTVENGTFVAKRSGKIFVTGNSQAPFTNFTFDLVCPEDMKNEKAIVCGVEQDFTYGDCQPEMDLINRAFIEIMEEGDSDGQVFTFPIPTYNIDKNFNWDSPIVDLLMAATSKYGIPYFANYVNSDMKSSDVRSMCPIAADEKVLVMVETEEEILNVHLSIKTIFDLSKNPKTKFKVKTPNGWVNARPNEFDSTTVYKITFSNELSVRFGENHIQPVLNDDTKELFDVLTKDLKTGYKVPFYSDNECLLYEIIQIEKIDYDFDKLYCMEVEGDSKYFLLANGLLTHNCRLRLDLREIRKRHGGLFGAGDQTGACSVVTINLPRIGYLSKNKEELYKQLDNIMDLAKESSDIKRKHCEKSLETGLLPYMKRYLKNGLNNHFSTIGIVGMNELLLNFIGKDIGSKEGNELANEILDHMNERLSIYQEESPDHILYNLEATPAEGTSYRLAKIDANSFSNIITASDETPYYTNSVHLPVDYTTDIFELLELQDNLQTKFSSGTVIHIYLESAVENPQVTKKLIKKISENYKLPYISITPTFSTCPEHGYLKGEVFNCPICGKNTLIWSRIVGYLRPIKSWNKGKRQEWCNRIQYKINEDKL